MLDIFSGYWPKPSSETVTVVRAAASLFMTHICQHTRESLLQCMRSRIWKWNDALLVQGPPCMYHTSGYILGGSGCKIAGKSMASHLEGEAMQSSLKNTQETSPVPGLEGNVGAEQCCVNHELSSAGLTLHDLFRASPRKVSGCQWSGAQEPFEWVQGPPTGPVKVSSSLQPWLWVCKLGEPEQAWPVFWHLARLGGTFKAAAFSIHPVPKVSSILNVKVQCRWSLKIGEWI